jgi:hypothetical protein
MKEPRRQFVEFDPFVAFPPGRIWQFFATEVAIIFYGFLSWFLPSSERSKSYSYHKANGYEVLVYVMGVLILVETVVLHLIISRWSPSGALIVTVLSLYGLLFLAADLRAAKSLPIIVDGSNLILRVGLRWRATIPLSSIEQARAGELPTPYDDKFARLGLTASHNVTLVLDGVYAATGLYGFSKSFSVIGLSLDSPEEFVSDINRLSDLGEV